MDIEKVIADLRINTKYLQEYGSDMDVSSWGHNGTKQQGLLLSGNEARALLDEIDRLRQRCGELEAYYNTMQYPCNELTALNDRLSEMSRREREDVEFAPPVE